MESPKVLFGGLKRVFKVLVEGRRGRGHLRRGWMEGKEVVLSTRGWDMQ